LKFELSINIYDYLLVIILQAELNCGV